MQFARVVAARHVSPHSSRQALGALALGVVLTLAGPMAGAQTIGLQAGTVTQATVSPSGKLTVPIVIDLSQASGLNIASLQTTMSWTASKLTFDSLRVDGSTGWALTANTTTAGTGVISFNAFGTSALAATGTLANAYFTAAAPGGTRLVLTPSAAGNDIGNSILNTLRTKFLDVCVGGGGKWGDVNGDSLTSPLGDGSANIIDAQQIARFSVGLSVSNRPGIVARGDVTADGAVNIIDAQQIARFSVGLSASARLGTELAPTTTASSVAVASVLDVTAGVVPGTAVNVSNMPVGRKGQITMTAADAAGASLTGCALFTYSSSNAAVATVSATGLITAVAPGSATITVTSGTATSTVNLTIGGTGTAGISVNITSPVGANRYFVLVDSGGLATPVHMRVNASFARTTSVVVPVPAGTGYRVRVLATDSVIAFADTTNVTVAAGGAASGVNVAPGATTALSVPLTLLSATFNAPAATITAGTAIVGDVSLTDPARVLTAPVTSTSGGYWCLTFGFGGATFADGAWPNSVGLCSRTRTGEDQARFTGNVFAPVAAGTFSLQAEVRAQAVVNNQTVSFRFRMPSQLRGQVLRTVTVTAATTGIDVNITSPVGVQRFIAIVDTGAGPTVVNTITGTGMTSGTIRVPFPAGANRRIRVMAVDSMDSGSSFLLTSLKAGKRITGITVTAGAFTSVPVTLSASSLTTAIPSTAFVNQNIPYTGTMVDPSGMLTSCGTRWSLTPLTGAFAGTFLSCGWTSADSLTFAASGVLPAQTAAGTMHAAVFFYQTIRLPDGQLLEIDQLRATPTQTVTISAVTTGAVVNFTSPGGWRRVYAIAHGGPLTTFRAPDSAQVHAIRRDGVYSPQADAWIVPGTTAPDSATAVGVGEIVVEQQYAGSRTGSITLPLPPGSNYDIRLLTIDSTSWINDSTNAWSKVLGSSGRATGVTVPATGSVTVPMTLATSAATLVLPDSVVPGSTVNGTFTVTDPADVFLGLVNACRYAWTGSVQWTRNSGIGWTSATCVSTVPAAGQRQWAVSFTAPSVPGPLYVQISVETLLRVPGTSATMWLDVYDRNLAAGQSLRRMTVVAPNTGIRVNVTSPLPTSRFVIVVDSGGLTAAIGKRFNVNFARNAQLVVPVPAGSGYRVRVLAVDSAAANPDGQSTVSASGAVSGVAVTNGAFTDATVTLAPITGALTVPATTNSGMTFNAQLSITDPGKVFTPPAFCAQVWAGTAAFADLQGPHLGFPCTLTAGSATSATCTGPLVLTTPGTYRMQSGWFVNVPVDGVTTGYRFLVPSQLRGQSLGQVVVGTPPATIAVTVNSPTPVSRFVVVADTGGGSAQVVATLTGAAMTTGVVNVPAVGGTWRIRVVAVDSIQVAGNSLHFTVRAGGQVASTTVAAAGTTSVTVSLSAIAHTWTPLAAVPVNSTITYSASITDPSGLLTTCSYRWSAGTLSSVIGGTWISCTMPSTGTVRAYSGSLQAAASTVAGTVQSVGFGYGQALLPDGRNAFLDFISAIQSTNVVQVGSVVVTPTAPTVPVAGSQQMTATVRDASNNVVPIAVTWSSATPTVASVSPTGLVAGVASGTSVVSATAGGVLGSTTVTVSGGISVGSITVTLGSGSLSGNGSTTATAVVRDPGGTIIPGAVPTWTSSDGRVARVTGFGEVHALGAGSSTIRATIGSVSGTAPLTVAAAVAGFNIVIRHVTPPSAAVQAAFDSAAARWTRIIRGDLPDAPLSGFNAGNCASWLAGTSLTETIDDLVIYANVVPIDGVSGILGSAGPCIVRSGGGNPIVGTMQFDSADMANMQANGSLTAVILHEMGHVLGIGTLWSSRGLLVDPAPSSPDPAGDPIFVGANAQWAFGLPGMPTYAGRIVPVENCCGSGTRNAHWRESILARELMTGFVSATGNPISPLTVTSLIDLGYVVDNAQADIAPYTITAGPLAPRIAIVEGPPPPIFVLQPDGSLRPLGAALLAPPSTAGIRPP